MASDIWSETLSGCPSDTDSDENKYDINTMIKMWSACMPCPYNVDLYSEGKRDRMQPAAYLMVQSYEENEYGQRKRQ